MFEKYVPIYWTPKSKDLELQPKWRTYYMNIPNKEDNMSLASSFPKNHTVDDNILKICDICVDYLAEDKLIRAVDHVNLTVKQGETFGLAGESGCGKSTLAFSISRLNKPPALISKGNIYFMGEDMLLMDEKQLRQIRWNEISVVLQSAMNCLNPVITICDQICDVILTHKNISKNEAIDRAAELMSLVGISPDRLNDYPHQFSGGMRQRAVIAITLALDPKMIIMDEPTTALDVIIERDIMAELAELKRKFGFTIILISHDLSLMGEISDRIGIMYGGRMVEISTSEKIIFYPKHPYTTGLINSFPLLSEKKKLLTGIKGNPVNLWEPPKGCYFAPRCDQCMDICKHDNPQLIQVETDRQVSCHLYK